MYKLMADHPVIGKINLIFRVSDGIYVPKDPDNTDYQAYLKWLEAGNTPIPAEENT